MDLEIVVGLLGVAATIVAGLFARRHQRHQSPDKTRVDLFDRRWACYNEFDRFINHVCQDLDLDLQALAAFDRSTLQVPFLFGEDVSRYRGRLRRHAIDLRMWNGIYRHGTQDPEGDVRFQEAKEGREAESRWFVEQFERRELRETFAPYLDLSELK